MAKIFVAVPIFNHMDPKVRENQQQFLTLSGHQIEYKECTGVGLDVARTLLLRDFLKTDCDYIFFLDADMIVLDELDEAINKLIRPNKDIIGGIYVYRKAPCLPTFRPIDLQKEYEETGKYPANYDFIEAIKEEPFEVQWIAHGFKLIKRKVIEEIFKSTQFPHIPYVYKGEYLTEDWAFDQRARDIGFTVWAQPDIKIGHVGNYAYTIEDYKRNK